MLLVNILLNAALRFSLREFESHRPDHSAIGASCDWLRLGKTKLDCALMELRLRRRPLDRQSVSDRLCSSTNAIHRSSDRAVATLAASTWTYPFIVCPLITTARQRPCSRRRADDVGDTRHMIRSGRAPIASLPRIRNPTLPNIRFSVTPETVLRRARTRSTRSRPGFMRACFQTIMTSHGRTPVCSSARARGYRARKKRSDIWP